MDNLISVFMNYKINRLIEYGVFFYQQDSVFIRQVLRGYFRTYVDNYYYDTFNTIEDGSRYTLEHLKQEYKGVMEEMLDDYRAFELQLGNDEYRHNQEVIRELNELSFEIIRIDHLEFHDKDEILPSVNELVSKNRVLNRFLDNRIMKLVNLVKETYNTNQKLLNYEDDYYVIGQKRFIGNDHMFFLELTPDIKALDVYKKSMVHKVYLDNRLEGKKLECLIQKISLQLLRCFLNKEPIDTYFLELDDSVISRGKIMPVIMDLIDNPMFRKYVVLCVNFNTYLNQRDAFVEDFTFACIQDFAHINDIYQKVDSIYKEGVFQYLIVSDCRFRERDFFLDYQSDTMKVLLFEED